MRWSFALAFIPAPLLLVAGVVFLARSLSAQDSVRLSLAGSDAAEARRRAASTIGYYNLKVGPAALRLGADLGLQYDTNIRLEADAKDDFIISPGLSAQVMWPVSEQNALNLNLSGGYSAYTHYTGYSRWFINPGSELSFDLYLGDFWINFHDRFTITTDNYQDPTVVGSADYSQLQNDAGVSFTWDLNRIIARASYDHLNFHLLSGNTGQPDAREEVFSLSGGRPIQNTGELGVEVGGALMHYDTSGTNLFDTSGTNLLYTDASQLNIGPYFDAQLTEYIRGRISVGYTLFMPENDALDNFSAMYAQIVLAHRLNQHVSYSLSGVRTVQFAMFGGTIDMYTAALRIDWRFLRDYTLSTGFTYEHGDYLDVNVETFDRYGPSISLGRNITQKLATALNYQFYDRTSTLPERTYDVHIVSLNLNYRF